MLSQKITTRQYGRLLYELGATAKNEAELKKQVAAFGDFLIQKGQTARLNAIIQAFEEYNQQQEGELNIKAIASRELDGKQASAIEKMFGKMLRKKIKLSLAIDKSILGGIVWQVGDQFFDGSLRGKLDNLAKQMIR